MEQNQDKNSKLYEIIDFIFQDAGPTELKAISYALKQRLNVPEDKLPRSQPEGAGGGPYNNSAGMQKFARETAKNLMNKMGIDVNPKEMAKNVIRQMLGNYLPPIAPEHIEALVDHYTEGPKTPEPELLTFMVATFLDYSLGNMPDPIHAIMKEKLPNWPEKFWKKFPDNLKLDIKEVIKNKAGGKEIIQNIKKYYK
jgi:hypothetical protein